MFLVMISNLYYTHNYLVFKQRKGNFLMKEVLNERLVMNSCVQLQKRVLSVETVTDCENASD